jgi:hypothetical protein
VLFAQSVFLFIKSHTPAQKERTMFKKITAVALALIIALSLAACGGRNSSPESVLEQHFKSWEDGDLKADIALLEPGMREALETEFNSQGEWGEAEEEWLATNLADEVGSPYKIKWEILETQPVPELISEFADRGGSVGGPAQVDEAVYITLKLSVSGPLKEFVLFEKSPMPYGETLVKIGGQWYLYSVPIW